MAKTIVITKKVRDLFYAHFDATAPENIDEALRAVIRHAEQNYAKHLKRMSPKPQPRVISVSKPLYHPNGDI